jgi:hypothetical protein
MNQKNNICVGYQNKILANAPLLYTRDRYLLTVGNLSRGKTHIKLNLQKESDRTILSISIEVNGSVSIERV